MASRSDRVSDWLRSISEPLEKTTNVVLPIAEQYADVLENGNWRVAAIQASIVAYVKPVDTIAGFRNVDTLALAGLPVVSGDVYLPETALAISPGDIVIPAVVVLMRGIDGRPHIVSAGALGVSNGLWRTIPEVSILE